MAKTKINQREPGDEGEAAVAAGARAMSPLIEFQPGVFERRGMVALLPGGQLVMTRRGWMPCGGGFLFLESHQDLPGEWRTRLGEERAARQVDGFGYMGLRRR